MNDDNDKKIIITIIHIIPDLCLENRCDADGFKVEDAGAAKSQILSLFRYI